MDAWGKAALTREIELREQISEAHSARSTLENQLSEQQNARAALEHKLGAQEAEIARLHQRIAEMDAWGQAALAHEAALKQCISELEIQRADFLASTSWRITAPLRTFSRLARKLLRGPRWFARGVWAWSTFKSGSRPRRAARRIVVIVADFIIWSPKIKNCIKGLLVPFPSFRKRVSAMLRAERMARYTLAPIAISKKPSLSAPRHRHSDFLSTTTDKRTIYLFVDHTIRCATNSGIQRVTRGLATGLLQLGKSVRYIKWDSAAKTCVLISREEREHFAQWNGPAITQKEQEFYHAAGIHPLPIDAEEGCWLIVPEVTHITFHPETVTLDLISWSRTQELHVGFIYYDAIPLRRDEFKDMADKHKTYMQHLRLADAVWPISRWARDDLITLWIAHEHATAKTIPIIKTLHLPGASLLQNRTTQSKGGEDFILCVGTIEPRKNQTTLIRAFQDYRKKHPKSGWRLILVGNLHPLVEQEVRASESSAILYVGPIPDDELRRLYERCGFTVFASVEEGFGLPILESLWHGKPCICANFGAMAEVADGGGCLTIDVRDQRMLSEALERMIEDYSLRLRLTAEATARPMTLWLDYAQSVRDAIDAPATPQRRLGNVYFWINATRSFPKNTGIQRVTRMLARTLMELGMRLVPVVWNGPSDPFSPASREDLQHLAKWNGPRLEQWAQWIEPNPRNHNDWFVMPELPLDLMTSEQEILRAHVAGAGVGTLAIFYDTIPWKMRDLYSNHTSTAHREYMLMLENYDLILPISHWVRDDLVSFLGKEVGIETPFEHKIVAAILPGEFPESSRTTEVKLDDPFRPVSILTVSTLEPRKNYETLIKAFAIACKRSSLTLNLTIVGRMDVRNPDFVDRLRAAIVDTPSVTWIENADDKKLQELYTAADFTVYPSIEEGFGLPVLESLWNGRPCICANFGAMAEVGEGGGCFMVDVQEVEKLSDALCLLADDAALRQKLAHEAISRPLKTWREYAYDVATHMMRHSPLSQDAILPGLREIEERIVDMKLTPRPKLSVCISTYNRAEWLAASLKNWQRLYPEPIPDVEMLVCDNASTDHTAEVVKPYLSRLDFSYRRNPVNVGMLGNLRETAHSARGSYIWILGDDDLIMPGAIESILRAIEAYPNVALCYLNYSFTTIEDAKTISNFDTFFQEATPIVPSEPDFSGPIRDICARNENFFTAIYSLVFRRDHALNAYSQNTNGRPFSTMLTCIPTTYYVLHHMMDEPGVWIGSPQVVVNMNVSWMKYAPLWILERIPEVYETAEIMGAPRAEIDRWRLHTLPSIVHFFQDIFDKDPGGNAAFFSPIRLICRFKHLSAFQAVCLDKLITIYTKAHRTGHPAATEPPARVFQDLIEDSKLFQSTLEKMKA